MRIRLPLPLALVPAAVSVGLGVTTLGPAAAAGPAPSLDIRIGGVTVRCADPGKSEFPQPYGAVAVGDLFGDGRKEVVAALPDGSVRAFDSAGRQLWQQNLGDLSAASASLADLDGRGQLSVAVTSYDGNVYVFNPDGSRRPGWPQRSHPGELNGGQWSGFFSSVAIGDAFGDGRKELFASGLDFYTYGWFADGSSMPGWPHVVYDTALATPTLYDLEHHHQLDIVTPSDTPGGAPLPSGRSSAGGIYWTWRPDGSQVAAMSQNNPDEVPWSSPAVDDLLPGRHTLVNGTGNFWHNGHYVLGYLEDGSPAPGFPHQTSGTAFASPAAGDLYGDGAREVVAVTDSGQLDGFTGQGAALPGMPTQLPGYGATVGGPAVAPVPGGRGNGLWVPDGAHLLGYRTDGGQLTRVFDQATPDGAVVYATPTVADLGLGGLTAVAVGETGNPGCGFTNTIDITGWNVGAASLPAGAWPTFHGNMARTGSNLPLDPPPPPPAHGYVMVARDGGVFPFGNARGYGSTGGIRLNQPIVGITETPTDRGYWLVAADGGIFPFGDAGGYGSTGGIPLNQPILGMAATPSGHGYWLVAADGGIFPFGDAGGYGSTGGIRLNQPIVGMAATPSGHGYWLVARDGGIFPFGDAAGYGSTGGIHLNQPIVAMAATGGGGGYWLVASDGGLFPFGDATAQSYGSLGGTRLNQPVVGMAATHLTTA